MRIHFVVSLALTVTSLLNPVASLASKEERKWDEDNNPAKMDTRYNYVLNKLPLAGSMDLSKRGWSDTYWPLEQGMIAVRWQVPGGNFDKEKSPKLGELLKMSPEQINLLSPAEKLDLALNDYEFTITTEIRKNLNGNEREWRGLCNGWTHASLNFDEPKPTIYTNSKGIKIPLGSSDIKAMLAYYYAKVDESSAILVGTRCRFKPSMSWMSKNCSDINPGSFHTILANELGIKKQGFAADRDPYNEVWNQPYVKYESTIVQTLDKYKGDKLSRRASKEAVKEVTVSSDVYYSDDEDIVQSTEPYIGTDKNKITKTTYNYVLELDVSGRIIGGEWLDQNRPDFVWRQHFNAPSGKFKVIQTIYEQSIKN